MSDSPDAPPGAARLHDEASDTLPPGTVLAEFEIREVLGVGGFGIVYRAWDAALQRDVALKEYMPVSLASRGGGERVTLRARTNEENFALGLQSFVNEARLLARFDQPALVKVFRFWEANGTAYMAMPLYKGRTLRQMRKEMAPGALDDAWLRALIEPLLGALEVMHDAAVYHRDIAPDNILWCDDNRPVLLDFGAARLVLADRTQNVTAILKPQFAPIEQYAETQSMRQGPWTDLYALAGTCYFLLTGRAPLPATARVMGDELEPLARLSPPGCSTRLLQILDWAMAVRPQDRPQSVAQFRDALDGRIDVPAQGALDLPMDSDPAAYERTIQATARFPATQRTVSAVAPLVAAPAAAPRRVPADELETPERSVLLPPKSRSSLVPLVAILVVAAAAAGAWTTKSQWLPLVGLQPAAAPASEAASSAAANVVADVASPASATAPEAASAGAPYPLANASEATASAASSASPAASLAPLTEAQATPPPTRAKAAREARASRDKALEARVAALPLPPPVLPPANEARLVGAMPNAASSSSAAPVAAPASAAPREIGPREVCAEQGPARMGACVKRLCETYPRYQHYPVCERLQQRQDSP